MLLAYNALSRLGQAYVFTGYSVGFTTQLQTWAGMQDSFVFNYLFDKPTTYGCVYEAELNASSINSLVLASTQTQDQSTLSPQESPNTTLHQEQSDPAQQLFCLLLFSLLRIIRTSGHSQNSKALRSKIWKSHSTGLFLRTECKVPVNEGLTTWTRLCQDGHRTGVHFPKRILLQCLLLARNSRHFKCYLHLCSNRR